MSKFIKINKFTGYRHVWENAVAGEKTVEETRLTVRLPDGKLAFGGPMMRLEADTFIDMQARGVNRTCTEANEYTIE